MIFCVSVGLFLRHSSICHCSTSSVCSFLRSHRRTSTALILSIFVWGFLVLVYPNMILTAVDTAPRTDTKPATYHHVKQMWEEFERKRKQFLRNDAVPGEDWELSFYTRFNDQPSRLLYYHYPGGDLETINEKSESQVPHAQNYHHYLGMLTVNIAERRWLIRKPAFENDLRPTGKQRANVAESSHLRDCMMQQPKRGQAPTSTASKIFSERHNATDKQSSITFMTKRYLRPDSGFLR